jgi:hypothetical protein
MNCRNGAANPPSGFGRVVPNQVPNLVAVKRSFASAQREKSKRNSQWQVMADYCLMEFAYVSNGSPRPIAD